MGTDDITVLPGAEPFSAAGGPNGALVLHGFSGSPQSMRGLAEAFAAAGFAVELPRLPGHGTSVDDFATTTFTDWAATAEGAYLDLATRCDRVVVAGLSMGATLAAELTARHPEIAGLVVINGLFTVFDPALRDGVEQLIAADVTRIPGPGGDVADPNQSELAYDEIVPAALLSLMEAVDALQSQLPLIEVPVLIINSAQDHVVPPASSDHLAASVSGPVERMPLTRSFHVATLDYERTELEARAVDFATRVTSS